MTEVNWLRRPSRRSIVCCAQQLVRAGSMRPRPRLRPRLRLGGFVASMLVVGCPGVVCWPDTSGITGGRSGAGTGMALGFGGNARAGNTASGSTSAPNVDTGCVTAEYTFQLTHVNVLFLLDKTGSMGYQNSDAAGTLDNCADQWNPVVSTLNAVFAQPISSRVYASLAFLTADGDNTNACDASSYSGSPGLKVPVTQLDDAGRKQFQDRLCGCASGEDASSSTCIVPAGGTPTRPAIEGTIDYASSVAQNYPGSRTHVVFITDGEPGFACQNSAGATQLCNSCEDLTNGCLDDVSKCLDYDTEVQRISAVIQSAPARSVSVVAMGTNLRDSTLNAWAAASGNDLVDLRSLDGLVVRCSKKPAPCFKLYMGAVTERQYPRTSLPARRPSEPRATRDLLGF